MCVELTSNGMIRCSVRNEAQKDAKISVTFFISIDNHNKDPYFQAHSAQPNGGESPITVLKNNESSDWSYMRKMPATNNTLYTKEMLLEFLDEWNSAKTTTVVFHANILVHI
jgi:hypothetical protein